MIDGRDGAGTLKYLWGTNGEQLCVDNTLQIHSIRVAVERGRRPRQVGARSVQEYHLNLVFFRYTVDRGGRDTNQSYSLPFTTS